MSRVKLISKRLINEEIKVYDLEVQENHNYYINNIGVSNCHEDDASAHILNKNSKEWVHLRLPMEFEASDKCIVNIENKFYWEDPRQNDGDLLWPEMVDREELTKFKTEAFNDNEYLIAGQLQQRPAPKGGGLFKNEWFRILPKQAQPVYNYIFQSWDTAMTVGDNSAYSACTTWGTWQDSNGMPNVSLISMCKVRLEVPQLREMIRRHFNNCYDCHYETENRGFGPRIDMILLEYKASGISLHQDFSLEGFPVHRYYPKGDKEYRASVIADIPMNGLIWLGNDGFDRPDIYGKALLAETSVFPAGKSRDVIDSMSQALDWLRTNNRISRPGTRS